MPVHIRIGTPTPTSRLYAIPLNDFHGARTYINSHRNSADHYLAVPLNDRHQCPYIYKFTYRALLIIKWILLIRIKEISFLLQHSPLNDEERSVCKFIYVPAPVAIIKWDGHIMVLAVCI